MTTIHALPEFFHRGPKVLRIIKNALFILGATGTGLVASSLCCFTLSTLVLPSGPDSGGAVGLFLILSAGAAVVGMFAGLTWAIRHVSQTELSNWRITDWTGIIAGGTAILLVRNSNLLAGRTIGDVIRWTPGSVVCVIAGAFVGGCAVRLLFPQRIKS